MLKCSKSQKIYVVCPPYNRTGGLELLHQLVYYLNKNGLNAFITYTNVEAGDPINEAYKEYVNTYRKFEEIEDDKNNLVIISEHQIELMDMVRNAKIAIWWLSVDNYLKVYDPVIAFKLLRIKGVLWYLKNRRWRYRVSKINTRINYNLAQSYYAIDYLKKNNFKNIEFLSDYINTDYLSVKFDNKIRKDVVLYNPKKGKKFSQYLMNLDKEIKWIPLINLTNYQVRELLMTSKVYVDFGNHPGKDRFPREAAICGCCVITGKRGSAKFERDVLIEEKYKFVDSKESGKDIIKCIKNCFNNFENSQEEFVSYRKMISQEQQQFENDVKRLFVR